MTIVLDHTIVRARNKHQAAQFFAALLGRTVGAPSGPFMPVQVNDELTLYFDDRHAFHLGHYAFRVDDGTFTAVLERSERMALDFGSEPGQHDRQINHRGGGRGLYVRDADGNSYEFLTVVA